jgi:dTDP-4-amino-4,6-dideoxygalactose transaminase
MSMPSLQPAYAELGYGVGDLPVTEALARQFLSLPLYAELQPEQISKVVSELQKACLMKAA